MSRFGFAGLGLHTGVGAVEAAEFVLEQLLLSPRHTQADVSSHTWESLSEKRLLYAFWTNLLHPHLVDEKYAVGAVEFATLVVLGLLWWC